MSECDDSWGNQNIDEMELYSDETKSNSDIGCEVRNQNNFVASLQTWYFHYDRH